jgi:cell division protein FtsB
MSYIARGMGNEYYRPRPARLSFKSRISKALRSRNTVALLLATTIVGGFAVFGNRGLLQRVHLESEKARLEESIQNLETEKQVLEAHSRALDGDARAIERVAREQYGMHRQGESVYRVRKPRD